MVMQTFNPNTQQAKIGESLCIWSQYGPGSEFQGSQGYV